MRNSYVAITIIGTFLAVVLIGVLIRVNSGQEANDAGHSVVKPESEATLEEGSPMEQAPLESERRPRDVLQELYSRLGCSSYQPSGGEDTPQEVSAFRPTECTGPSDIKWTNPMVRAFSTDQAAQEEYLRLSQEGDCSLIFMKADYAIITVDTSSPNPKLQEELWKIQELFGVTDTRIC